MIVLNSVNEDPGMSDRENPVLSFLKKIPGTLFRPTRTFEMLADEPFTSALIYAGFFYIVFLAIKFFSLTVWSVQVEEITHAMGFAHVTNLFPGDRYFNNDKVFFFVFNVLFFPIVFFLSILVMHAHIILKKNFDKMPQFRKEPSLSQTARIFLDCCTPVFLFGIIPMIGIWIGFSWLIFTLGPALSAHYGEIILKGTNGNYHYPCIHGRGVGWIIIIAFVVFIFGPPLLTLVFPPAGDFVPLTL